jgi:hypothetical protein
VNKRGKIKNVNITRGAGDDYNNAVLEAVRNMPDWIPAIKEGKNVDEKVILPIFLNFGE